MLVVYSAHGSPGASTTAMYLAAQWASTGTEVLLLEADPAGGSLSHHLGIQFTPGLASFVASGLEVRGGNLIDHSQDVLFNNLHVMPATSSPTGARQIVKWLDARAEEFRTVAETELAVIIDGGRVTTDSATAALTASASGVVVVARGDSSPTSLEHIGGLLSAEACGDGVERCVVTVGDSPMSSEEWRERCGITFCGAIKDFGDVTGDLAAFLNRNRRKSRRWRVSLEEVAESLLPYAKPPAAGPVRARRSEAATESPSQVGPPATPPHVSAEPAPVVAAEPAGPARRDFEDRGAYHEHPERNEYGEMPAAAGYADRPRPEFEPYYGSAGGEYGEGPPPQPYSPSVYPPPPAYHRHPPEWQPEYLEPRPAPAESGYDDRPPPLYEPPRPQGPFPDHQGSHSRHPSHHPQHPAGQGAGPDSPAEAEVAPSGSFRDWAARLHGQVPTDTSSHGHGGVS